ncbi:E3 ubiquitin-protein ligase MARCHF5-like [Paramacrobiotus metropolitanus]|uniref:E3 ubiquitin-protein ligase MARCHF5-like n=1 Tax=Paramacrobiotus metropolitanus TaxID=2943436 RepID=UPI00244604CA|nr:E3 ubiquitin-protein ligase MARCHF5-like [Paramacrobiotus metropolitanus]
MDPVPPSVALDVESTGTAQMLRGNPVHDPVASGSHSVAFEVKNGANMVDTSVLERACWVCFAGEEEEPNMRWLRPCRCRGSTKWVHYSCLQRWIDAQQKGIVTIPVACPQCGAFYLVKFGDVGIVHKVLDRVERYINKACPYFAGLCLVGATYWTAVSYGALTVMQVLGHREGLQLMERSDPMLLLLTLPSIPACLIWGKMLRWEDYIARNWRWIMHSICPFVFDRPEQNLAYAEQQSSPSRILCGALVFPTIATLIGRFLLGQRVKSNLERTVLGGSVFIAIKGILRIYYKLKHNEQYHKRQIMDAPETRDADTQADTGEDHY